MSARATIANYLTAVTAGAPEPDVSPAIDQREYSANQPEVCPRCYGTGIEVVAGNGARRCRCRAEKRLTKLLAAARIPRRYRGCSFSNYHPAAGNGAQLQAFNYAFKLADEYRRLSAASFHGQRRTGRHFVGSDPTWLDGEGNQLLVYEFGALLKEIQSSYNGVAYFRLRVLAPVYEAESAGTRRTRRVKPTDWVRIHDADHRHALQ